MANINIATKVSLATAERSKQWFEEIAEVPLKHRAGGRCATLVITLHDFAKRVGEPHEAVPVADWYDYDKDLLDGAGKVSAQWYFDTPRGLVTVSDYWWNPIYQLSVNATDDRAIIWFRRWAKEYGFVFFAGNRNVPDVKGVLS